MAHFLVDPDRAITLLDSAVVVGNLTPSRAGYLKAIVEYNGKEDNEAAFRRCQQLIDEESWKSLPDSEDVVSFQVDLYRLMATICTSKRNYLPAVRYARQGAELSHGIEKLRGDEADFHSRIGQVLSSTGQYEQALESLRRAESLSLSDDRWSSLISYLNNAKKLCFALLKTDQYADAKQVILAALARLEHLRAHLQEVRFAPEGMIQDPQALEEFIQYYQVCYDCSLVNIYAGQQQPDSALIMLSRLHDNPLSANPSITSTLVDPLIQLGRYDEAESLITDVLRCYGADTLNNSCLELKKQSRQLASLRGDYRGADLLSAQILSLNEELNASQMQMSLAYAMTEYHLQDERLRREDAEARLLWFVICAVLCGFLLVIILSYSFIRRLLTRQQELNHQVEAARKQLANAGGGSISRPQAETLESIYQRAVQVVEQQQLYSDSSFDINMLSQLVMTNRHYVSEAINIQSGMNFRSWLAKFRVEHAKKLMLENPSISMLQLATACGYDNRVSLYRQFKNVEGVSPSEWLEKFVNKS